MNINFKRAGKPPQGLLAQIVTVILGAIVLGVALMFSLVFVVAISIAGLIFWLYFWWKTRAVRAQLRKQMQDQPPTQPFAAQSPPPSAGGEIFEGEAVRVVDEQNRLGERETTDENQK